MAQNRLPVSPGALVVLAGKCRGGVVKYGTTLGITQITPTLTGQTGGQTVELYATAVNPAGESVPSAAIGVAVA